MRHEWFKVGSLAVLGAALALIAGPLVGAVLILVTEIPLVLAESHRGRRLRDRAACRRDHDDIPRLRHAGARRGNRGGIRDPAGRDRGFALIVTA